ATVRGVIEKSEHGYTKVQTDLTLLRRAGDLPYDWLADNTRWQRKPTTFASPEQALLDTAKFYRKDLWVDADAYVEVWLEKDALAGVIYPTTSMYDVPLMVARGYASLSFLHSAAEYINDLSVPTYIYHLRLPKVKSRKVGLWSERACFMLRTCTAACLAAKHCSLVTMLNRLRVASSETRAAGGKTAISDSSIPNRPFTKVAVFLHRTPSPPFPPSA